jgi:hypothetical protein
MIAEPSLRDATPKRCRGLDSGTRQPAAELLRVLLCVLLVLAGAAACVVEESAEDEDGSSRGASPTVLHGPSPVVVERLPNNPILRPEMLPGDDGENINGPSLIRVPEWIERPLGRYYLYFAHHQGRYIRLAYADDLAGPWKVHEPGVLGLAGTPCDEIASPRRARGKHIASPDVHVDLDPRRIRMYFHCPMYRSGPREDEDSYSQSTLLALSSDGLRFEVRPERLGPSYFRVFAWQGAHYALDKSKVYRSGDGLDGFEEGPRVLPERTRHTAVRLEGSTLFVFLTRTGDDPEHVMLSTIDLSRPWLEWRASEPVTVLVPEEDWEGARLPAAPSESGLARGPHRQLRDPAIFEEDGETWLLYSVAGESGIAMARLRFP